MCCCAESCVALPIVTDGCEAAVAAAAPHITAHVYIAAVSSILEFYSITVKHQQVAAAQTLVHWSVAMEQLFTANEVQGVVLVWQLHPLRSTLKLQLHTAVSATASTQHVMLLTGV
jgi:hypothetical protein